MLGVFDDYNDSFGLILIDSCEYGNESQYVIMSMSNYPIFDRVGGTTYCVDVRCC